MMMVVMMHLCLCRSPARDAARVSKLVPLDLGGRRCEQIDVERARWVMDGDAGTAAVTPQVGVE